MSSSHYKLFPSTPSIVSKQSLYNIKLNQEIQTQLIKSVSSPSASPKIKLIVQNGELSIKVNDERPFKLENLLESTTIEIYKKFSSSTYKNIGRVQSKLVTTSPISSPNVGGENSVSSSLKSNVPSRASTPSSSSSSSSTSSSKASTNAVKKSPPTSTSSPALSSSSSTSASKSSILTRRIIHVLAFGPIKSQEISFKLKIPQSEVDAIISTVGMAYDPVNQEIKTYPNMLPSSVKKVDQYLVLDYSSYKDLRIFEKKYTAEELSILKKNCLIAFNHLGYPKSHPAREYLLKNEVTKDVVSSNKHNGLKLENIPTGPKNRTLVEPKKSQAPDTRVKSSSTNVRPQTVEAKGPSAASSSVSTATTTSTTATSIKGIEQAMRRKETSPKKNSEASKTNDDTAKVAVSTSSALEPTRKRKLETVDDQEEYFRDLAIRFKSKYKEYEQLYKTLTISKETSDLNEIKRLYRLHKNLESWKKQLWNSVATSTSQESR